MEIHETFTKILHTSLMQKNHSNDVVTTDQQNAMGSFI